MALLLILLSFFQVQSVSNINPAYSSQNVSIDASQLNKSEDNSKVNLAQTYVFDIKTFTQDKINYLELSDVNANAILVKEINGKTLFSKNADQEKEIASITKLMTAYLAYTLYLPEDSFIFDRDAINQDGEVGNFYIGEKVSRDDLLKAALIASSNDAAYLLAEKYGVSSFVNLMNKKAKEWRMVKTNFLDPTGLNKNISTAKDLYILVNKIYSQTPEIFAWTRLEKIIVNNKILWTTNSLLPKYKSIIVGAKTGFTPTSGENLVMILKFEQSPFVAVILLDSKDRWTDAEKVIKALQDYYGGQ